MAGKMRSPNYPAFSLGQALESVGKLWTSEKRTAVSHETAAAALGYKGLSGPARVAIGAMRQYGLIDKAEAGHVRVSDLAVAILHGQGTERDIALGQAAMMPSLFIELSKTHADASETAIRSYLITKKDFGEDGAKRAAKAFKDTWAFAIADKKGYTPHTEQEKPENMPGIDTVQNAGASGTKPQDGAGILSLKVPYGAGALAVEIRVTGERLKKSHIARVRKYLELAEDDLENGSDSG